MIAGVERGGGGGGDCSHVSLCRAGRCVKQPVMAMSLSAEDEDYDSDSEQVSTLKPCRTAGMPVSNTAACSITGQQEMELPGEECTACSCLSLN